MNHQEYIRVVPDAKTAVLMIHGILGTPRHFDMLIPLIPEEWSVYNILLDGHGNSVDDFSASSMRKWKGQVWQLFEELSGNYDQIIIVAHSMGTLFAIELALEYPQRIPFLFLLAVPLKIWLRLSGMVNSMKFALGVLDDQDPVEAATKYASSIRPDWRLWKYVKWIPRFWELFVEIRTVRKLLPQLQVPCCAFQSHRDELVANRAAKILSCSGTVLVDILQNSGHYYYEERDKRRLLDAFSELCKKHS